MTQHARLQRELFALTEVAKALTLPLELADLLNAVLQKIGGVIEPAEAGAGDDLLVGQERRGGGLQLEWNTSPGVHLA